LGKIFNALEKFAKESGNAKSNAGRKSYYDVLMQFDQATGKINIDNPEVAGDSTGLKRLMTYGLVRANGTLTPAGRAKYEEMKSRPEKPQPSRAIRAAAVRPEKEIRKEKPFKKPARLEASDWAILLKYDRKTGNLLKYDPQSGRLDESSVALLRNPALIQRFIDNNWILPGGWLTPQAKEECARIEEKLRQKRVVQAEETAVPAKAATPPAGDRSLQKSPASVKLSATDMEALMDFDPQTRKLNTKNRLILKDPQIIKRLLESGMIAADGKLTPRAMVRCRVLSSERQKPEGQTAASMQKESTGAKPAAPADREQARAGAEGFGFRKLKVIHLKKEGQKVKKAAKEPVKQAEGSEPAVKERETTAPAAQKTPAAKNALKDALEVARVRAAAPDLQKPARKAPDPEPVAKPPAATEKPPETGAAAIPGRPQTAPVAVQQGYDRNALDKNLVALLDPQSFEAEQFKILRTNMLFPESGRSPRLVMVTSALPGEGKSFVAANLAVSVAQHVNWNVLLIDCDLRRPSIHRQFGYQESPGLSDYLSNGISLQPLLLKTRIDNLTILPSGKPPRNPSELLSSDRMSALLKEVAARYQDRLIIIDSPPPRMAAESGALARLVDGIVLVVKYASTPREAVSDLIDKIGKEKVLGAIINRFEARSPFYKSHYYGK
jgi:protein-tyrosine kinase